MGRGVTDRRASAVREVTLRVVTPIVYGHGILNAPLSRVFE